MKFDRSAAVLISTFFLGALSTAVAAGGVAVAATGQIVNIADGTTAKIAKVDGVGRLNVVGSVVAQDASPSSMLRAQVYNTSENCTRVYAPPSGKAAIITAIQATDYDPSPGGTTLLRFYLGPTTSPCSRLVVDVVGQPTGGYFPIDPKPGIAVPAGWALSVEQLRWTAPAAHFWSVSVEGYTVGTSQVPVPTSASARDGASSAPPRRR